MPRKVFSSSIAAGGTFSPTTGWDYEFLPWPARVEFCYRASAVGVLAEAVAGSDRLTENDPVPAGGVAGTTPTPFNTPVLVDEASARDRIKLLMSNPTGGAITVDGYIDLTPL
jgi:hypothetical protein